MKTFNSILFISFLLFVSISVFSQRRIIVNDDNFKEAGWEKRQIDLDPVTGNNVPKSGSDFITIHCNAPEMNSPGGQRMKRGSAYLSYPKVNADIDLPGTSSDPNLFKVLLYNNRFHGVRLADITELMYSSWTVATASNMPDASGVVPHQPIAPTLLLQIDMYGDSSFIDNINFHPMRQDPYTRPDGTVINEKVKTNVWQEWNVLDGWWVYFKRNPGDPVGLPGKFLLKDFIKEYPNAKIVNTNPDRPQQGAGFRFLLGTGPDDYVIGFKGYVDGVKIHTPANNTDKNGPIGNGSGNIVYDFEATCPDR